VLILTGTVSPDPLRAKAVVIKRIDPKELFKIIERFLPLKS
jgi:hypothetical protein